MSENLEDTAAYIEDIVQEKFGDEELPLVTVGASMGGYAAVCFGEQLGARFVLAIAPQTIISIEGRSRLKDPRWKADFEFFKPRCADLRHILKGRVEKLKLVVGAECVPDVIQAANLAGARNVSIDFVKGADHDVVQAWRARSEVADVLGGYIEAGLAGGQDETPEPAPQSTEPTEAEALEPARS